MLTSVSLSPLGTTSWELSVWLDMTELGGVFLPLPRVTLLHSCPHLSFLVALPTFPGSFRIASNSFLSSAGDFSLYSILHTPFGSSLTQSVGRFFALGCRLAALCRPAGLVWVVGREIGDFLPWGTV